MTLQEIGHLTVKAFEAQGKFIDATGEFFWDSSSEVLNEKCLKTKKESALAFKAVRDAVEEYGTKTL